MDPEQSVEPVAEKRPHVLFRVTPFSKYAALALFVAMPFLGFWLGIRYTAILHPAMSTNSEPGVTQERNLEKDTTTPRPSSPVATYPVVRLENEYPEIKSEMLEPGAVPTTTDLVYVGTLDLDSIKVYRGDMYMYLGTCRYSGIQVQDLKLEPSGSDAYPYQHYLQDGQSAIGVRVGYGEAPEPTPPVCPSVYRHNFVLLGGPYERGFDDGHIYYRKSTQNGVNHVSIPEADANTFHVSHTFSGDVSQEPYATDTRHVYFVGEPDARISLTHEKTLQILDGIDPHTFETTKSTYVVKDKDHVYINGKPAPDADPNTYAVSVDMGILGKYYGKDAQHCFLNYDQIDCSTMPKDGTDAMRINTASTEQQLQNLGTQ